MNFLTKGLAGLARSCITKSIEGNRSQLTGLCVHPATQGSTVSTVDSYIGNIIKGFAQIRFGSTLKQIHYNSGVYKPKKKKRPLDGNPFLKGVVLKTLIRKPKKPNSANRKCVLVRLSNGKEMVAYVPGIGHNLQEHNIVLCKVGRLKDTPGVKIRCVRGKYDLPHVVKKEA